MKFVSTTRTKWDEVDWPDWIKISHPTAGHLLGEVQSIEGDGPRGAYYGVALSVPGFEVMPLLSELEADGWILDAVLRREESLDVVAGEEVDHKAEKPKPPQLA